MDRHAPRATLGWIQNPVRGLLHGTAALLSAVGAVALWHRGAGDPTRQTALLIFGASLLCLYTVSSLYHAIPWRLDWKQRIQRLDHSMIYVLIAGTYTPMAVVVLDGPVRQAALGAVWGIAALGIAQKILWPKLSHAFSLSLQVAQGWLAVLLLEPVSQRLPSSALVLLVLGGILYTLGAIAFATQRPRLWPRVFSHHEVFHVLVVAGSAAHYAMTFVYVAGYSA